VCQRPDLMQGSGGWGKPHTTQLSTFLMRWCVQHSAKAYTTKPVLPHTTLLPLLQTLKPYDRAQPLFSARGYTSHTPPNTRRFSNLHATSYRPARARAGM
jgi:hypothetical protein